MFAFTKHIKEYIEYHKECIALAKQNGKKAFSSESTDLGLLVTLKATAEICDYLIEEIGFKYGMTTRLNQDAVEVSASMLQIKTKIG